MIKFPQETVLGSLSVYDKPVLEKELLGNDTSYGIKGKHTFKVLTGKSSIEAELPVFNYPYKLKDSIIIDVRAFVKDPTKYELSEMLNTRLPYEYQILSGLLVDNEDLSQYRQLYIKLIQILVGGRLKSQLNLSVSDSIILNNILAVYATDKITDYNSIDALVGVAQNNIIGEVLNENDIKHYIGEGDLSTINGLCKIFSKIDDASYTLQKVTEEIVYDSVGGTVFNTHRLGILIGLESPYLMLSLLYTYSTNTLYKKSGLVFSVDIFKKVLGMEIFETKIKQLIKDYNIKDLF